MVAGSPDDEDRASGPTVNKVVQSNGNVFQFRNMTGNINNFGQPRQSPHTLQREVPGFAGRDTELAHLDELRSEHPDRGCPIVISGPAGVGKSALALHWAHRNRAAFPDGELHLDLGGYGPGTPMRPKSAVATMLRFLREHQSAEAPTLEELSGQYRTALEGRRMLVLLDNVADAGQARHLLPGDNASLVLLTSRDELADIACDATRIVLTTPRDSATPERPLVMGPSRVDPPVAPADHPYDVFVSYTAEDTAWVAEFVGHLSERGIAVAHDVLLPGDPRAQTVERAIMNSRHGLLVFSRAALEDGWVREEYEVLLKRARDTGQLFIPVLIDEVSLPPFADGRACSDFRGVSEPGYRDCIDLLVRALQRPHR